VCSSDLLAIAIALSPLMLDSAVIAIPPTAYGVIMMFTAAAFALWVSRRPPVHPVLSGS
jgi:BASS family bile acid:Na+ symporter